MSLKIIHLLQAFSNDIHLIPLLWPIQHSVLLYTHWIHGICVQIPWIQCVYGRHAAYHHHASSMAIAEFLVVKSLPAVSLVAWTGLLQKSERHMIRTVAILGCATIALNACLVVLFHLSSVRHTGEFADMFKRQKVVSICSVVSLCEQS